MSNCTNDYQVCRDLGDARSAMRIYHDDERDCCDGGCRCSVEAFALLREAAALIERDGGVLVALDDDGAYVEEWGAKVGGRGATGARDCACCQMTIRAYRRDGLDDAMDEHRCEAEQRQD